MFLFSGRGYWQELIESIIWAYNKVKVALAIVFQCQCRPSKVLLLLVFFLISTHFTVQLEILSDPIVL